MTIGVVILLAGVAALFVAALAPMGFGGRSPIGNIFTALIGVGALIFGISYIRTSVQMRRARRELQREGVVEAAPGEFPSPAATPDTWDAEGLPRMDPTVRPQQPVLPSPWRHTGI